MKVILIFSSYSKNKNKKNPESLSFIRSKVTNYQHFVCFMEHCGRNYLADLATDTSLQQHTKNPYRMPSHYHLFIDHLFSKICSVNVIRSCSWHFTKMIKMFSNTLPCFVFISFLSSSSFASTLCIQS